MKSLTPEEVSKLAALQEVTNLFYFNETEIHIDVLWAIATTMRATITGEDLTEAIAKWKRSLTEVIESSRFVSRFETAQLTTLLSQV